MQERVVVCTGIQ